MMSGSIRRKKKSYSSLPERATGVTSPPPAASMGERQNMNSATPSPTGVADFAYGKTVVVRSRVVGSGAKSYATPPPAPRQGSRQRGKQGSKAGSASPNTKSRKQKKKSKNSVVVVRKKQQNQQQQQEDAASRQKDDIPSVVAFVSPSSATVATELTTLSGSTCGSPPPTMLEHGGNMNCASSHPQHNRHHPHQMSTLGQQHRRYRSCHEGSPPIVPRRVSSRGGGNEEGSHGTGSSSGPVDVDSFMRGTTTRSTRTARHHHDRGHNNHRSDGVLVGAADIHGLLPRGEHIRSASTHGHGHGGQRSYSAGSSARSDPTPHCDNRRQHSRVSSGPVDVDEYCSGPIDVDKLVKKKGHRSRNSGPVDLDEIPDGFTTNEEGSDDDNNEGPIDLDDVSVSSDSENEHGNNGVEVRATSMSGPVDLDESVASETDISKDEEERTTAALSSVLFNRSHDSSNGSMVQRLNGITSPSAARRQQQQQHHDSSIQQHKRLESFSDSVEIDVRGIIHDDDLVSATAASEATPATLRFTKDKGGMKKQDYQKEQLKRACQSMAISTGSSTTATQPTDRENVNWQNAAHRAAVTQTHLHAQHQQHQRHQHKRSYGDPPAHGGPPAPDPPAPIYRYESATPPNTDSDNLPQDQEKTESVNENANSKSSNKEVVIENDDCSTQSGEDSTYASLEGNFDDQSDPDAILIRDKSTKSFSKINDDDELLEGASMSSNASGRTTSTANANDADSITHNYTITATTSNEQILEQLAEQEMLQGANQNRVQHRQQQHYQHQHQDTCWDEDSQGRSVGHRRNMERGIHGSMAVEERPWRRSKYQNPSSSGHRRNKDSRRDVESWQHHELSEI